MRISIETGNDGSMVMYLDFEAARAVLASVVFASRFSKRFDPLAQAIERRFHTDPDSSTERRNICR
jgi:hypothetical protein